MTDLLTAVAIIFIIAGPFLLVGNRLELPTIPLLIVAGIIAGLFIDVPELLELAQYGIALLVFTFGVRIQFSTVRTVLADSELAALGQVLVVGSLGVGFGMAIGVPAEEALYLGVAGALSSTIVGTALFEREIRRGLVRGRLAESIHLVQDLLAIGFLLVLGAGTLEADPIATQLGYGLTMLVVAALINRHLFDMMGRLASDSDELMIVGVVSMLVLFIGASELAGIPFVVGAFAAGLAVRHDPVEYLGLFNGLQSIRDFFVAIFFVTIGALIALPVVDITWAATGEKLLIAAGLVFLTAVVKPAVTIAILLYKGYERRSATLASLSLDQVSEFALIIAIEAFLLGYLTDAYFDAIIFAAAVTMITSSLTQRYDEQLYRFLRDRGLLSEAHGKIDELSDVPADRTDHVVVVGYGRHGRRVVEACESADQPYVVIENDPVRYDEVRMECEAYVFGDAMERYTWTKANVADATVIVSTVDSEPVSMRQLRLDFGGDVILRARDSATALDLLDDGARYVIVSDLLAGRQLVEQLDALLTGEVTPEEFRTRQIDQLRRAPVES
ncbi:cation:proton antiporter [Halovivax gelatinilyticus]|uniref:cation:proton antiporter n=1 Tax=Halovivax gelatinilyticus TaxID=2961597 RepID=UPI0020CA640F|nr:cation:proton antiporter [Halovivax gelatinilyticus]